MSLMTFDGNAFLTLLADATRRRILMLLARGGDLCVCEITGALQLAQPRVSTHLAALRKAGVVRARKEGLWVHYQLNPEMPSWARAIVEQALRGLGEAPPYADDAARLAKVCKTATG